MGRTGNGLVSPLATMTGRIHKFTSHVQSFTVHKDAIITALFLLSWFIFWLWISWCIDIYSCTKYYCSVTDSPKGAGGESSSLDEDSSDALSPDQLTNHDSPLSAVPQLSPADVLTQNGDISPTQVPLQNVNQTKREWLGLEIIQTIQKVIINMITPLTK